MLKTANNIRKSEEEEVDLVCEGSGWDGKARGETLEDGEEILRDAKRWRELVRGIEVLGSVERLGGERRRQTVGDGGVEEGMRPRTARGLGPTPRGSRRPTSWRNHQLTEGKLEASVGQVDPTANGMVVDPDSTHPSERRTGFSRILTETIRRRNFGLTTSLTSP